MKSSSEILSPISAWCVTCSTRHDLNSRCPGDLQATGPEKHSWRGLAETPLGTDAYGVLIAQSHDLWRARILTYPNVLWLVPGGVTSLKFAGNTARGAERRAIDFIKEHCKVCEYTLREDRSCLPATRARFRTLVTQARKVRFLPVRFGLSGATEIAGTGDLSETGMFIITDTPADPGTQLRVALETPDRMLELDAEVRWMRRQHHVGRSPGMGVFFKTPPAPYISYVRSLP
jgi:hypothetical protein